LIHPIPTIDHVVVNTRDQLDDARAVYEQLGFTLTPIGHHTLGSANHLAMFGTDYLELVGVPQGAGRADLLGAPAGLNGLVFATEDAAAVHGFLEGAGVAADPPREFSRPVTLPGGTSDAVFRTVHLTPGPVWPGRLYFCQHLTRDIVWRDEWRHHANGAVGVARTLIASDDPRRLEAVFGRMFGLAAIRPLELGFSLVAGLSQVDVLTHEGVAAQIGGIAGWADGRTEYMAALTLRTASLALARTALAAIPVVHAAGRITVPAASAFGCVLEFVE
jgi:hypothetical protein